MYPLGVNQIYEMLPNFKDAVEEAGGSLSIDVGPGQIVRFEGERIDKVAHTESLFFTFFNEAARPVTVTFPRGVASSFNWQSCLEAMTSTPIRDNRIRELHGLKALELYEVLPNYPECVKHLRDSRSRLIPVGACVRFIYANYNYYDGITDLKFASTELPEVTYWLTVLDTERAPDWSAFLRPVPASNARDG